MDVKSYDRRLGETEKAYTAFVIYRDLGFDRSLKQTAVIFYGALNTPKNRHPNIRMVQKWAEDHEWAIRVLDFDRDEEAIARERARELDRAEHDAKLEVFRHQQEQVGNEMTALSGELTSFFRSQLAATVKNLENTTKNLENTTATGDEETAQQVKLFKMRQFELAQLLNVSQICKCATAFATVGEELSADGLLIRQMLEKLKEDAA